MKSHVHFKNFWYTWSSKTLITFKLFGIWWKRPAVKALVKSFLIKNSRLMDQTFRDQAPFGTIRLPKTPSDCNKTPLKDKTRPLPCPQRKAKAERQELKHLVHPDGFSPHWSIREAQNWFIYQFVLRWFPTGETSSNRGCFPCFWVEQGVLWSNYSSFLCKYSRAPCNLK